MNAVDLDHQQIKAGEVGRYPLLHARRRQRHEAAGSGRFRQPRPHRRRNVALGQPNRTGELARRDVDQHLVHGPLAEPVLCNSRLPARQSLLLALEAAKPGPLDLDLAAVKTDLAPRLPPAVPVAMRNAATIQREETGTAAHSRGFYIRHFSVAGDSTNGPVRPGTFAEANVRNQ